MRLRLALWGLGIAAASAVAMAAAPSAGAAPRAHINRPPALPMELPGDRAMARVASSPDGWIVAGRPSATTERIAQRFGATTLIPNGGVYRVARAQARPFAAALRAAGALTFAEADRRLKQTAYPSDPLSGQQWAQPAIRANLLTPPPVTPASPILGIIEDDIAIGHPEFAGAHIAITRAPPVQEKPADAVAARDHGTMVTSVAAAPDNGVGMLGIWPGARVVLAASTDIACSGAVQAIFDAMDAGASVLNMSYGIDGGCQAHRIATNAAFGRGLVLVAAAGNEFEEGNPSDQSPSADPHVITVAAVQPDLSAAPFSNAHAAVDLSAPGTDVLAAVPPNAYAYVAGTSFSSPIVAAATAWVKQVRPDLDQTQLTDLMRFSVRDLGPPGWDIRFGFGLLDLPTALTAPAPPTDPLEPNDDIPWINGTFFQGADPPISRGKKKTLFTGRLDVLEDPADVYRVFVPKHRTLRIAADPTSGATNLKIFTRKAKTIYSSKRLIGRARRKGGKADRLTITNRTGGRKVVYVVVYPDTRANTLDAEYKISVRRTKYKRHGGLKVR